MFDIFSDPRRQDSEDGGTVGITLKLALGDPYQTAWCPFFFFLTWAISLPTLNTVTATADGHAEQMSSSQFHCDWSQETRQDTRGVKPPINITPDPSRRLTKNTRFVPGMKLDGPGSTPFKRSNGAGPTSSHDGNVYSTVGSGTVRDPTVGWLFDVDAERGMTHEMKRDHVEVARQVARRNGFACVLIRRQAHARQCTYAASGARNTVLGRDGRRRCVLAPADPHVTVYMGPSPAVAQVGGHIYVVTAVDRRTGRAVMRQMDDPATQRRIVLPGEKPVAEEFWLTSDTWPVSSDGKAR